MNIYAKLILVSGSLLLAAGVMFGAFGAHALKKSLSQEMMAVYDTAVQYHFIHAMGMLLIGVIYLSQQSSIWLPFSALFMLAGIVLFCGSLYAISLTGISRLGIITPIGGLLFILSWLLLAIGIYRS